MKTLWLCLTLCLLLARPCGAQGVTIPMSVRAILEHADRVETFRLADFHEMEAAGPDRFKLVEKHGNWTLDNHVILWTGRAGGAETARRIGAALDTIPTPPANGLREVMPSCFDPGIGFRVWRGRAYVDLCVCFYCSGIEIAARDAKRRPLWDHMMSLGVARAPLLALSAEAFPHDPAIQRLRATAIPQRGY